MDPDSDADDIVTHISRYGCSFDLINAQFPMVYGRMIEKVGYTGGGGK